MKKFVLTALLVAAFFGCISCKNGDDDDDDDDGPSGYTPPLVNSVDETKLQEKLDAFDSENELAAKVKISYDATNAQWLLAVTENPAAATPVYTTQEDTYSDLSSAISASFSQLTVGRNKKEKILLENGGTVTKAIELPDYTILDFGGQTVLSTVYKANYIHLDRKHDISIRNGTLTGNSEFLYNFIYMGACSNIVVDTVTFTRAEGAVVAGGRMMRIQSSGTAQNQKLDNGEWSHDIYIDNVTGSYLTSDGIECYCTNDVHIGTVTVTDAGGCGILLDSSRDVEILKLIATRCCTGREKDGKEEKGGYAAFRCANDVGPNIKVHYVYGEACGRGVFFCSSDTGIDIDEVVLVDTMRQGILHQCASFVNIHRGVIRTDGSTITYQKMYKTDSEELGSYTASTDKAIEFTRDTSSLYLPEYHNIYNNLTISGYSKIVTEKGNNGVGYNTYIGKAFSASTVSSDDEPTYNNINGTCYGDVVTGDSTTEDGATYKIADGAATLISYKGEAEFEVPATVSGVPVTAIASFAFHGNSSLTSITFPESVTSIGDYAFAFCSALQSVTFAGDGSVDIHPGAFRDCTALTTLDLTGVQYLRDGCFGNCTALVSVDIPESVTYFGTNCFYNAKADIVINGSDASKIVMENYAFYFLATGATLRFSNIASGAVTTGGGTKTAQATEAGKWSSMWVTGAVPVSYK